MSDILIDTNILIYFYDSNTPIKQARAELVLDYLQKYGKGLLSAQNLAEFVSAATRKLVSPLTKEQAYEQVELLIETWPILNLTPQIILEAARGVRDHQLSYYDAQIWASARLNQIPVVFSEDFQDGQILEGVHFINPFSGEFSIDHW
jgi:predicted nucleic acid-binding protein